MEPKSARRKRICGTPVRTGCTTCKIRRIKCGEEKPFCNRCNSTGRKCDGYMQATAGKSSTGTSPRKSLSPDSTEGTLESEIFSFFHTITITKLSDYFFADFWRQRTVQASEAEPCVRHAIVALGAIHQGFIDRHQNNGVGSDFIRRFALNQYTQAMSHLQKLIVVSAQHVETTLTSCILFICLDLLSDNYDSAIIHLRAGLEILENDKMQDAHGISSTYDEFGPLLLGLGVHATSCPSPGPLQERSSLLLAMKTLSSELLTTFSSLDEARHSLDSLTVLIRADTILKEGTNSPNSSLDRDNNVALLCRWSESLDRLLAEDATPEPSSATSNNTSYAVTLLRVHHLVLLMEVHSPDALKDNFERILGLCQTLVDSMTGSDSTIPGPIFSVDIGVMAPLYFVATKAPELSQRQQALSMLSEVTGREGMWYSEEALRIASAAVSAFEQHDDRGNMN